MAKKKKSTQVTWASKDDLMNKVTSRRENAYANGWMDRPSQPTVTGSTSTDAAGNVTSRKGATKSTSSSSWASADDLLEKAKKTYGNKQTAKVIGSTGIKNGQYWTKSAADNKNKTIREKTAENTESKLISNQNLAREWVNAKKNSYNAGAAMKKATGVSELKDQQLDQNEKIKAQSKAAAESRNAAVSGLATKLRDKLFGTTNGNDTVGQFGSREEYETDALKARTYSPSIYNSYVKQGQELAGSSQKKAEKYLAGQSNLAGASDISRNTEQDYYRGEGVLTASPDIALHEMTDDEANNYYYILKRYGETDANKYKNYVLNDVNARIAQKAYRYNQVNHRDDVLGTAGKVRDIIGNTGTQFEAGLIAAGSALPNLKAYVGGTDGVTATPVSSYYASEMLENTENPVEKIAYELAQNTGYMAPAIAAGAVTQNAAVQDVLLGLQSASNSYAESIREGKSQDDARLYATFSGFDEYATNKLLDGAGLVGGGILTKAVKNSAVRKAASEAIERIGSPVLKKALSSALEVGADMGGEATQEFLQNFTDRLYRRIAFGEGAGEVDWKEPNTYINALKDPEAWHDAMIGALNAGLMQSGRIVSGAANTLSENAERKEMFRNPETYSQIAEGVDTSTPEGKRVQELAQAAAEQTEQGKTVSAMQQDEIYQALNEAVQTAADEEDIAANKQQVEENQEAAEAQAAMEEATAENAADQQEIQEETTAPAREETTAAEASEAVPYAVMADQEEAQKAQLKKLSADELSRRISENNRQFLESYTKNYDPEGQKAVLRNYTDGRDLVSYMSSASEVYNMARHGARQDQLGARRILLSDAETEDIWKAGWRDREASIERVLNTSYKERQEKRTGGLMSAVPETSESMKKVLDTLGKKTGIAFVVTDSGKYGELGSFNAESGVVTVDLQSDNPLGTVSHEMTHWVKAYNPAGYQLFEDAAMQSLARSEHFSLDAEMDKYKRAYPDLTNDEIREEIVANSTETFLNDEQFIRDICSGKNKSIGKRIVEWLTDVIDAFKEMISDRSFSRVADVLRQDVKNYERTRQLWMDGIDEAAENMETKQYVGESKLKNQAMLHPEVVNQKHMEDNIRAVREMKPIFTVTENKINGFKNAGEILDTVSKFYERHGREAYNEDVGAVELNDTSLKRVIGHRWYAKKMAVLLNLKEMIEGGKMVSYETNHQSRTSGSEKHFDTAMLASKIRLKIPEVEQGNYYAIVTLNINTANNKAYAHDVDFTTTENGASTPFSTKRNSIPPLIGNGSAPGELAPSTKTIFEILRGDNTPNDDFLESNGTAESHKMESNGLDEIKVDGTKFQRKIKDELDGTADVEQTKTLIAVHNLTADKLMKIMEYDGIPMPSIAVTKAEQGWDKFGDISLVFRKDTIDPKANRKNKVYGADAWTATFPQIDFEVDEKAYDRVAQQVREDMAGKAPDYLTEKAYLFNRTNAGNAERRGLDGIIDAAKNDEGMKAAFLASKGEKIEDRTREVTTASVDESDQKKYRAFFNNLTPETRKEVIHMYSEGAPLKEVRDTYGEEIIDAWCDAEASSGAFKGLAEKRKAGYRKNGMRLHNLLMKVSDAVKFQRDGVQYKTETVRDEAGIRQEINNRIDEKAYEKWIRKIYSGLITGSGVHNGKDLYTPSGTRRTFKQLHYEVTPENIVKSMLSQGDGDEKNVVGFMGIKTLRAAASGNFNSISDMHKAEGRIQSLTEAEFTANQDALNDRLMNTIEEIARNSGGEQNYSRLDNIGNIIEEAAKKKNFSEKVLRETFNKYPIWKASDENIKELTDIVKEAATMPTDMFEAKPQRVVGYDEIATALVPNSIDEDAVRALEERGINVTYYDAEQEGDRNEKLKNMDGIRFQLRLDDEDAFSGTMEEQNEKLKRANAYLTTMLQTSKDLTPSSKDISRTASEMLKEYNSKFDKKKLTDQLTKLYTYIRTSENIDGAEVTSVAEAIAKQVVDTAVAVDPEEEATWKRLRQEMRKTSIYISPDDISDLSPEGYGALRKKWFGKINLTTKEESRENTGSSEYRQLKESFPEVFTADPDSFFNEADAVQAIFDAYEQARPRERSVFGTVATAQEAAADLSNKIIDGYFSVGNENIKTQYQKTYKQMRQGIREEVLNDYNKELNKIVIRDREKLSELKKAYAANEIAPETYLVQKDALNDYARQQREAADARFREKRDKNIEYGYRATYKRNIMKDSQSLLKMIESPSDKSHVPEAMVEPMLNILSRIDFSSNRVNYEGNPTQRSLKAQEFKNSVSSLMDTVRQIEKNNGMLETESSTVQMTIDPDLMENLRRIQNLFAENEELSNNIDNLSTQNMREVWESLRALKKMVESANKFFATQNNTTVEEAATRTISELGKRKADTRWTGGAGALKKLMTTGMMDSYTYMHELGTSGAEMYQEARDGLDKKIRKIKRSVDFMSDLKKKHHLDDKTLREWSEKPIKVKLSCLEGDSFGAMMGEKEVEIKPTQIMSLYLLNQRNQARQHLYGDKYSNNRQNGGFQLDEIKREGIKGALGMVTKDNTVYKVSEGTVDRLTSMLTPEQKAVAMEIGRFLTDETSAWGNEVTMQLYGYNKFQAKNYFPIRVADDTITKTSQQIEQGMTMLKNMGMTKSVQKKAYNPLILEDIFDVFVRQADEMSSYNAYVPVIADIQKWYNYKGEMGNVQRSIERVMGKDGSTYMMNLLRDLNGGRDSDEWNVLYGMAGKYKGAAVGANLRTAIQQPTAYARAMAVMDPKYLLQGLTLNPRESAKQYELCQEYAPIALWKEWGSYDINVGRSMNQILMGTSSKLDQVREASMWLAGKGDEIAWVRLWYSAQKQVEDQTDLKPGTKEFYEESAKVFNHVIDTTQVVDSVLHRSDMMKDKSVYAKSLTSFMAEPTKTYNMLYRAWASLERGEKGAKKNAARIAAVYVITAVLTTAAASVVSALRDDDKDKTFGEKYIEKAQSDLLDNLLPWNNIPFVKDLISVASGDDATDLNTEGLSNLFEAIEEAEKAVKGESKYGPLGLLYKASDAGSLIGLALRNGMKDMGGLIDTFVIGNNSEMQYWRDKLMYNMQAQNSSGEYSNAKYFLASAMRAYAQGDTEVGDRIAKELKEIMGEEKINNMMKNQLQKEPEVEELGEAMLNNDTKKIEKLKKSLLDKGYSEDQIEAKAESALNKLAPISTGDLAAALYDKTDGYQDSLNAYIEYQKKLGKTDKDIQSKIRSALTSKYKQEYIDNPGKRSEMAKKLYSITVNRKQLYTSKDLQSWLK